MYAQSASDVGCVLLTGNGPSPKDAGWAFSSGGDQRVRGDDGYQYDDGSSAGPCNRGSTHDSIYAKVVIAVVPGWAVGGGHSLHVVYLTIASKEHTIFKQTDPDVASFDSGYGSAYLAKHIGQKRAREIFFWGLNIQLKRRLIWGW